MTRAATPIALGVFFTLSTVITAAVCVTLAAPEGPLDAIWSLKPRAHADLMLLRPASTVGFAVLSLFMAAAALGCFARKRWGLTLAAAIFAVNAAGDAVHAATGAPAEGLTGVAVAAIILWWLTRPRVRGVFS